MHCADQLTTCKILSLGFRVIDMDLLSQSQSHLFVDLIVRSSIIEVCIRLHGATEWGWGVVKQLSFNVYYTYIFLSCVKKTGCLRVVECILII